MKKDYDVIVVGGGPSGMSASLEASKMGASVLLIERAEKLGGILNQCIHNGFGLKKFNEELTGPEFAHKLINEIEKSNVEVLLNTFVCEIAKNKVKIINNTYSGEVRAKAIILASGCRERTAGQISLLGTRPSGVVTAGYAQKMINTMGFLPGKKVVILGSGDIGLIMARRLTLEGAKVLKVLEIMKESSGLKRNIKQCVEDFGIDFLTSTTITKVVGTKRVTGIYYAPVDEHLVPILEKEKFVKCDCVLLSVGLIPELDLIKNQIMLNASGQALVDENRMTTVDGLFVSGNCLQIHDLADNASLEGEIAGRSAGNYALGKLNKSKSFAINKDEQIASVVPERIHKDKSSALIFFRSKTKIVNAEVIVVSGKNIVASKFFRAVNPGEMHEVEIDKSKIIADLTISITSRKEAK